MRRIGLAVMLTVSFILAPLAAEAQAGKVLRIGFLWPATADEAAPFIAVSRQRLRALGYVEGRNVALEMRYGDGRSERFPGLAAELVRLQVDVIVAVSNPAIAAAQKATTSIPIVMAIATDPVALGFVASLARPGGNITGLSNMGSPDVIGKGLQLLKEAVPKPVPSGRPLGSRLSRHPTTTARSGGLRPSAEVRRLGSLDLLTGRLARRDLARWALEVKFLGGFGT